MMVMLFLLSFVVFISFRSLYLYPLNGATFQCAHVNINTLRVNHLGKKEDRSDTNKDRWQEVSEEEDIPEEYSDPEEDPVV